MQVISHRGYWKSAAEKNRLVAFQRSFERAFGTETDIRDAGGELVVSHDPPMGGEMSLDDLLDVAMPAAPLLALNIKSDGLAAAIAEKMARRDYAKWFVFDMSIPDTRSHLNVGNPVYIRVSEIERDPPFLDRAAGIWLDGFDDDGWRIDAAQHYLDRDLSVCLVSPELHRRDHLPFWEQLAQSAISSNRSLILCTDFPEDASELFVNQAND